MSLQAKTMITLLLLGIGVFVIGLLRKRKLSESYTLLWLLVVVFTVAATWADRFLAFLTTFFGAIAPVSALTLLSLVFILVMLIFFSMKISRLGKELKELAQQVALRLPDPPGTSAPPSGEDPGPGDSREPPGRRPPAA
ncbi:MAG: hypothetical protein Kow00128_16330 [Deltaproteobacteria bacterium]